MRTKKDLWLNRLATPSNKQSLPGFTLIELSIVMIIVGIIMAGVFKGQDLIESARLQSTLSEMNRIKMIALQYREQFGAWPGNDKNASNRLEGAVSGNGKGLILAEEGENVWKHLAAAQLLDNEEAPTAKVGGIFSIKGNPTETHKGNWIILSGEEGTLNPSLTPKQAMTLKSKMDEVDPNKGKLRVINGQGIEETGCVNGSTYNLKNDAAACVVMMYLGS